MNPTGEEPIDDVEIVEEGMADAIGVAEVADDAEVVEPDVVDEYYADHYMDEGYAEGAAAAAESFPRSYGYLLALMCLFAGSLCMLIGYGYTINHVPAPWFGVPVVGMGIYFLIFPRSSLVRGTFENMRRR